MFHSIVSLATRWTMSATSAVRAYTRDIAGEAVRMMQASESDPTTSTLERVYAPLRPTTYRPSRPSPARVTGGEERPRPETTLTVQPC
jgi:hypothetical protein